MTQLTAARSTLAYGRVPGVNVLPQTFYLPLAASTTVYQGALVTMTSTGLVNAVAGTGGVVVGRVAAGPGGASSTVSTTANVTFVTVDQGCFLWDNTSTLTTYANFGTKVYADTNHSVTSTAGSNAAAGYFVGTDSATGSQAMVVSILGAFGAQT